MCEMSAYIDQFGLVARSQVVKDRCFVEIGQVGHILAFLKLGRVDLLDLLPLEDLLLVANGHLDLAPVLRLQHSLHKAALTIGNPVGLLGIVGLGHVLSLHLEGEEEVGSGIWILSIVRSFLLIARHLEKTRRKTLKVRRNSFKGEKNSCKGLTASEAGPEMSEGEGGSI